MSSGTTDTSRRPRPRVALWLAVALLLAACVVVVVLSQETSAKEPAERGSPATAAAATAATDAKETPPSSSLPPGSRFSVPVDGAGTVRLAALGIRMVVGPELARQGLVGVVGADPERPSTSVAFTTAQLLKRNAVCDGTRGWIGVMTRYEGSSANMGAHDHPHGSTMFDFPGFHISYQTVQKSCVASAPGYAADELTKETIAARQLWEAMGTAEPL